MPTSVHVFTEDDELLVTAAIIGWAKTGECVNGLGRDTGVGIDGGDDGIGGDAGGCDDERACDDG